MSLELFSLKDKKAVVTGASSGIGQALAVGLAEAGADVALIARTQSGLDETATMVDQAGGGVQTIQCDVSKPEQIHEAFSTIAKSWPEIDILINNAGTNIRTPALDVTVEDYQTVVRTNLDSAFFCSREAVKLMVKAGNGGRVIGIASVAGVTGVNTGAAYAGSKAGMSGMTRALALEWGQYDVTVNCIAPWYFRTPLSAAVLDDPKIKRRVVSRTPLGRIGKMEDLIGTTIFLASEAGAYVTGQTIVVDGGMTIFGYSPFTEDD
jgi:NAD(P)-dependent dehydrogenase (short-subunit alcohol dehydrogenase family)